ncbi:DUF821 domain protein [Aspergillus homomorphus CBS 101889]|uniref:Glycosyl transferase CAP10 domain-containing protein n=1 Tax=Aspergillus homomorphus (strain CBS 101889) TaxID=1450537 RepID=A0A395I0M4_ASPHC|nr:hypothetical protein BO97DRAFT_388636 [Aspergillus homomorphus CBS 101889]RAL13477.1 hypothetical protein BO97DRAFT_388636 [Aspergillus homomorphus CBS 101889]
MYSISKTHLLATAAVLSLIITTFLVFSTQYSTSVAKYALKTSLKPGYCPHVEWNNSSDWEFHVERDGNNYGLTAQQCRAAFPKLFVEIDKSTATRKDNPITFDELDKIPVSDGMVRGIIDNGQLYILDYAPQPATFTRAKATLHALHRALSASPSQLPSLEFILTTEDFHTPSPDDPTPLIWSYTKQPEDRNTWLMPDFGYWSWPEVHAGPYSSVRARLRTIDEGSPQTSTPALPFQSKRKQLLWRGATAPNPSIRGTLLKATQGKSWASVRVLDWDNPDGHFLPLEDHCRYMFLAHTEGRSFSGRGKYLLNCKSVVVSHPLRWVEAHHAALVAAPHPEANYVQVADGWADLEEKMRWLIDHPVEAERIAVNAVAVFRDRYLTPAAEACYWRELVTGFASVLAFEPVVLGRPGVLFEDWVLGV